MRLPRQNWIWLFLITAAIVPWSPVHAEDTSRLTISPVTFELSANPGETLTNQFMLTNGTASLLQMEVKTENISGTDERGQVNLSDQPSNYSLSSWVKTNPTAFNLAPKENKIINFTITVPANAEPGGHYGSILASTVASNTLNSTGAIVSQRLGPLVLVKVNGQTTEDGVVKKITPKSFVGNWDTTTSSDGHTAILVPKDEQYTKEKAKNYFNNGPIAFDITYENLGNVHFKTVGYLTIYDIFGRKVAEQTLDPRNVFPGGDRTITVIWPKTGLWGIKYHAKLAGVYGDTNQPITGDAVFWAFPMYAAIGGGVFLLFLLVFHRRFGKALRILVKGS